VHPSAFLSAKKTDNMHLNNEFLCLPAAPSD
jgi:hypothetical protein